MGHHINIRKMRQYNKALLSGRLNTLQQGYEAEIEVGGNNRYIKTDVRMDKDIKKLDVFEGAKVISRIIERSTAKAAKREAARYGGVISLRKISQDYYLHKIEYMEGIRPAATVEVLNTSVTVNKAGELQKPVQKPITIEISDK